MYAGMVIGTGNKVTKQTKKIYHVPMKLTIKLTINVTCSIGHTHLSGPSPTLPPPKT